MGLYKHLKEQLGGGDPDACLDRPVCGKCLGDAALKALVEDSAAYRSCEFCGAESDEKIASDLFIVVEQMAQCLGLHYTTAEEVLPYESAEGGYQGEWWTTEVMVDQVLELPNDEDGELRQAIIDSLGDRTWCKNPYSLNPEEHLRFSWEEFCHHIKHERRFLFLSGDGNALGAEVDGDDLLRPGPMLDRLGSLLDDHGLIEDLPAKTRMHRARKQRPGEKHDTALALGPPPEGRALQANRMSPPGIVMFYAGEDAETALRETADHPGSFGIGEFETAASVPIVDLTQLPDVPSIFDVNEADENPYRREELIFLWEFAEQIAMPIERNDRVHLEYVPTQVITEYVRLALRAEADLAVMGIKYSSARSPGKYSLVLFADQRQVEPSPGENPNPHPLGPKPWLRRVGASQHEVTEADLKECGIEPDDDDTQ